MRFLYSVFVLLYGFGIQLISVFNAKAALWVKGRKTLFKEIEEKLSTNKKPIIWMHAASLGEFEQGRPVLESIKQQFPGYALVLTFFSPSGYEVRKNYPNADFVFYLPLDTPKNAKLFLEIVPASLVIFIKYEYWYNYLKEIEKKKIPMVIISAIFRKKQIFFSFYGSWFLNHLKQIDWFFVQNQESLNLLNKVGILQCSISGDTRFDRVAQVASLASTNPILEQFKGNSKLLLVGSSWPKDETLIYPLLAKFPELKIVIAPHLIDEKHIKLIKKHTAEKHIRYSEAKSNNVKQKQVLIVDNFGLLSALYLYADFTYIGGGFGAGLHNTLEAATFGMPIFIGPNYKKFQEAVDLVELKAIKVIEDSNDLEIALHHLLSNPELCLKKAALARNYVKAKTGAANQILDFLKDKKLIYERN
ncbi:MAG: glycosyltransferase N-terminal domain-containing protein [Bacteroidota bacterium]